MKHKNWLAQTLGLGTIALIMLLSSAQAEVRIINLGGAFLPRESETNVAFQGDSWAGASVNWMNLLRTRSAGPLGAGRQQVTTPRFDLGDYSHMVTSTAFNLWNGEFETFPPAPTKEWGNFFHCGVQIVADDGDTFRPLDVTYRTRSFTRNAVGDYVPGSIDRTVTFGTLNYFRQVLNNGTDGIPGTADDTVSATQDPNAATTNFLYGGAGFALTASGSSPTSQGKIDATAENWWNNDYTLRYTITVDPVGESPPVSTVWEFTKTQAKVVAVGNDLVITNTLEGRTYAVEHTPTLSNWVPLVTFEGGTNPTIIPMPHRSGTVANPLMFYRLDY